MCKINWWELPLDKFSVHINKIFLKELYSSMKRYSSTENLFKYLIENCNSFKLRSKGSTKTKFYQILNGQYPIPLDLLFELTKLSNVNKETINNKISKIACNYFKEYLHIKFPIEYDEDFAVISEIIRSEGNLSKDLNSIQLANSDTRIINQFLLASLNKFNIKENKVIKSLYIKISFLEGNKQDINITNSKGKIINFHIANKVLKNEIKKQIHIMDYNYTKDNIYTINGLKDRIECNIKIPKQGLIKATSTFTKYKSNITSSLHVRINNKTLAMLLNYIAEIPEGKKSHLIYIPKILKYSPDSVLKKAFEVTFKCEGNVDKDQLRIKSISDRYLKDWKEVLNIRFNIFSNISTNTLAITCKENFEKFYSTFDLLKEEKIKVGEMLKRRNKLPQRYANGFYLAHISSYGHLTSKQLAIITNRTQACTKRQLTSLYYRGLINRKIIWQQGKVIRYDYFIGDKATRSDLEEVRLEKAKINN